MTRGIIAVTGSLQQLSNALSVGQNILFMKQAHQLGISLKFCFKPNYFILAFAVWNLFHMRVILYCFTRSTPFFHQYTPLCILSSKAGLIRYISHLGRAHVILSVLACFYQTDVHCMIQLCCFSPWISEFPVRNVNIHTRCWFVFMYNHMKILEHITNGKLKKSLEHLQCLYKCRMQGTKHIHIH